MTGNDRKSRRETPRAAAARETDVTAILHRHKDLLVDYVYQMTGSPDRAVEIALESALALGRPGALERARKDPRRWLIREATRRISRREWKSRLQRIFLLRRPHHPAAVLYEEGITPGSGLPSWERLEQERPVREAVRRVRLKLRRLLVLCDILGIPSDEAAHLAGLTQSDLKNRLDRARSLYRSAISRIRET